MQFKQADILKGLDKKFIGRLMEIGYKSTYEPETVLFNQGESANHFFILIKGHVRLSFGKSKNSNYMVNHGGEAFGWSSLTGRKVYSASATCVSQSTLIAFDCDQIEEFFTEDPVSAAHFYKNLALTLGNRLILTTSQLADNLSVDDKVSYGTGQIQETIELV